MASSSSPSKRIVVEHVKSDQPIDESRSRRPPRPNPQFRFSDFSEWNTVFKDLSQTGEFSNFAFIVGEEEKVFHVHRDLLELRSAELAKVLDDEEHNSFHKLPNINPIAFDYFLKYLYGIDLPQDLKISEDELFHLLQLSVSFNPTGIYDKCVGLLERQITNQNVCKIYENLKTSKNCIPIAKHCLLDGFLDCCFRYMSSHAAEVVQSDGFESISNETLLRFLKSDQLLCNELALFQALLKWSKNKDSVNQETDDLGETMKNFISLIRFPLMTSQQFAEHVAPSNLLSLEQLVAVYTYLCADNRLQRRIEYFSDKPRSYQAERADSSVFEDTDISSGSVPVPKLSFNNGTQTDFPYTPLSSTKSKSNTSVQTDDIVPVTPLENSSSPTPTVVVSKPGGKNQLGTPIVDCVEIPLSEVEFIMPTPLKAGCSYKSADNGNFARRKTKTLTLISPPGSVISSVNNGHLSSKRSSKKRAARQSDSDSDSDDCLACIFSHQNLNYVNWETMLHRFAKSEKSADIEGFKIDQCRIVNLYPRVIMPKLQEFLVDLVLPINPHSKANTAQSFNRFLQIFDIRKYLYFAIKDEDWNMDDLWTMKISVHLVINGVTFLKMSRIDKEVTISFRGGADHVELMGAMIDSRPSEFEKLNLVGTDFPSPGFTCSGLKELVLYKVIDQFETELPAFLKKCKNLEKLSCYTDRQKWNDSDISEIPVQDKSPLDLARDLVSKQKLKKLALSKILVLYNPSTFKQAQKINLTEFYTDFCHFSPEFYQQIHELFPNLQKVSFRTCEFEFFDEEDSSSKKKDKVKLLSCVSVQLLLNILKIKSISWIRMWSLEEMDWRSSPPTVTDDDLSALKQLLENAGLPDSPKNFELTKNVDSNDWEGKEFDEKESKNKDNGFWEYMDELEYEHFDLHKIYKNCETFQLYGI